VSLWELTQAYTLWSDGGKFCEFTLDMEVARKGTSCKQILSKNTIDQIVQSLSSQDIKSQEFPYGSTLDFGEGKVFVKTGTSRNFRDNYAIGFTHDFLIGVWTGNKDGENMRGVTGASGAGEIFAGIIQELGGEKLITDPISTESISHIQSDIRKS
jgi:penicillin-binding protein 1C